MVANGLCEIRPTEFTDNDAVIISRQKLNQPTATTQRNRGERFDSPHPGKLKVLVVDNERTAVVKYLRLVRRWGHAACGALDGLASLRVAAAQHPDVVLLNLDLPDINGLEVARQLRLDFLRSDCLIIAIIAEPVTDSCRQCSEANFDLVLTKPIDQSVIETLLILESIRINRICQGASSC